MSDLKELHKIVKFMRKVGISKLADGALHIELSPAEPPKRAYTRKKSPTATQDTQQELIPTDWPTDEEMLYYSAGGPPTQVEEN